MLCMKYVILDCAIRCITTLKIVIFNCYFSCHELTSLLHWWLLHWACKAIMITSLSLEKFKIITLTAFNICNKYDDVIKWKHFPRYWPFVRGIHRSPVNSPHKGQWRGALMFTLMCARINGWVNNREAGDLRRYRAHYDVIVMYKAVQKVKLLLCVCFLMECIISASVHFQSFPLILSFLIYHFSIYSRAFKCLEWLSIILEDLKDYLSLENVIRSGEGDHRDRKA